MGQQQTGSGEERSPELLAGEALGEEAGAQQEASRLPPRQRAVCACLALGFGLGIFRL